jgi:hypothetical protein
MSGQPDCNRPARRCGQPCVPAVARSCLHLPDAGNCGQQGDNRLTAWPVPAVGLDDGVVMGVLLRTFSSGVSC